MRRMPSGTLSVPSNVMDGEWLAAIAAKLDSSSVLDPDDIGDSWALAAARDNGPPVIFDVWDGNITLPIEQLMDEICDIVAVPLPGASDGGRMLRVDLQNSPDSERAWFLVPGGLVSVYADRRGEHASVELVTRDSILHDQFQCWADYRLTGRPLQGAVYTIVTTRRGGFETQFLDFSGSELVRDNYTDETLRQYDRAVAELNKSEPAGRVVILCGPTGTGKTHLVRAFMHDVEESMFIVLPQGMVESLVGPSMIPLLLDLREGNDEDLSRIVFVLEDADDALVPRDGGNINLISALLNFGDGILGHALNIRIIATTNQPTDKIDPAIKRPGRMIARLHLGNLTSEHAQRVLRRLNPKAALPERGNAQRIGFGSNVPASFSLAEVYEAART